MADEFKVTEFGPWQRLPEWLKARNVRARLQKEYGRAAVVNARTLQKSIVNAIMTAKSWAAPLSPMTTILRGGSSSPLYRYGDLAAAINTRIAGGYKRVHVGILEGTERKRGIARIAATLEKGAVIRVTGRMRRMFKALNSATKQAITGRGKYTVSNLRRPHVRALANASIEAGEIIPALKESTTVLIIPPRPFLAKGFNDPVVRRKIHKNYDNAMLNTFVPQWAPLTQGRRPGYRS